MLEGVDSEPRPPPGRQPEIDARLEAIRARLDELRERDQGAPKDRATADARVHAARLHAAEAHAAAVEVLAASAAAFRRAAEAHEHAASVHKKAAAAGIGDVLQHEQQATFHEAAAAADRQRAENALSLLSGESAGTVAP